MKRTVKNASKIPTRTKAPSILLQSEIRSHAVTRMSARIPWIVQHHFNSAMYPSRCRAVGAIWPSGQVGRLVPTCVGTSVNQDLGEGNSKTRVVAILLACNLLRSSPCTLRFQLAAPAVAFVDPSPSLSYFSGIKTLRYNRAARLEDGQELAALRTERGATGWSLSVGRKSSASSTPR